jgi:hypothetical protein
MVISIRIPSNYGNFGGFFPKNILCMSRNPFFGVAEWQTFARKKNVGWNFGLL